MPLPQWPPEGTSTPIKERKISISSPHSSCTACGEKAEVIEKLTARVAELEAALADGALEHSRASTAATTSSRTFDDGEEVEELRRALDAELQRRRAAESTAAEQEGQLVHLRQRLAGGERELKDASQQLQDLESQIREMRQEKNEAETKVAAKEAQLEVWKKQVAELSSSRPGRLSRVVSEEALHLATEDKKKEKEKSSLEEQLMQKELEICTLQKQLTDELSKRQAVQWQVIEKDRVICDLQQATFEERQSSLTISRRFKSLDLGKGLQDAEQAESEDTEVTASVEEKASVWEVSPSAWAVAAAARKAVFAPFMHQTPERAAKTPSMHQSPQRAMPPCRASPPSRHRDVRPVGLSVQVPVAKFVGYGTQPTLPVGPNCPPSVPSRVLKASRTFCL